MEVEKRNVGRRNARNASQSVCLWSTGSAIVVSAGENITPPHRRGSSQPASQCQDTCQQSHNPLLCVSDEGTI